MFDLRQSIGILVEMARQDPKNFHTCRTPQDVMINVISTDGGIHVQLYKSKDYPDEEVWRQVLECLPVKKIGEPIHPLKMELLGRYYLTGTIPIEEC